jgi:hypothetical protein
MADSIEISICVSGFVEGVLPFRSRAYYQSNHMQLLLKKHEFVPPKTGSADERF